MVIADKSARTKPHMGPLVVMSGFLTRKNRTLNRWKQRWWQLLDSGMLLFYKNDDRAKLLGKIDIAHSCYDVKFGRENCKITFPRVAPSCCCFSFTVLKRSYYLYAPTAAEAKKWAESIESASRVLNRRLVAGVERRKAPAPPGPPRPPSCPPNMRINRNAIHAYTLSVSESMDDSYEMSLQLPSTGQRLAAKKKMASSMPDLLDRAGYSPPPPAVNKNPNDRLWLDGSPYPVTTSTFGQTFPSPPASYTNETVASIELSASLVSFPRSASSPRSISSPRAASSPRSASYGSFQLGQEVTAFQWRQNSKSNTSLQGSNGGQELSDISEHQQNSGSNGQPKTSVTYEYQHNSETNGEVRPNNIRKRIPSRSMVKNRCSLPIIFEHSPERQGYTAAMQSNRPASCVPNPLSSSTAKMKTIPWTTSSVTPATRVPIFPGLIFGDLQKKKLNGRLAASKKAQPQPLPRNRTRAQSVSNHLDNQSTANRPVPKPRRSKGMLMDQSELSGLERTMSCDFISSSNDQPKSKAIAQTLQATLPKQSVSLTTSKKVPTASPRRKAPPPPGEYVTPPPRPKRDSGPPPFIPTPPPLEELDSTQSTCSSE